MALSGIESCESDNFSFMDISNPVMVGESEKLPTPTGSRVLVEIDREPEKVGSLFMPESKRRHHTGAYIGTVVSTGPGAYLKTGIRRQMQVKPGDKIMWMYPAGHDGNNFNKPYADGNLSIGERKLVIIEEDDIFAVVE